MPLLVRRFLPGLCLVVVLSAHAEVTRVEVTKRSDLDDSGYEEIVGRLHYAIDPELAGNAVIADLQLAPKDAEGRVVFSSDLRILRPKDPEHSANAAWVEIPNRGGRANLGEWFVRNGFTVVSIGWEFDLPPAANRMRLEAPVARNADGSPIRGVVNTAFTPDKSIEEQNVTDLEIYPAIDPDGPDSRLLVRNRAGFPGGTEIDRSLWRVEGHRVRLEGGFEPGKTYEVSWLAEGPPVAGLGYAAIRDAVSWLKHGDDSLAPVSQAYAFGSSQCGRFLRDYLYLGFNTDENDLAVLDGVMAHVAGAGRLVLNERWSKPRSVAGYYTASYPFADSAVEDPVSGHRDGVLENSRTNHLPKIFYTNMAAEYWGAGRVAALTHADPAGTRDVDFPDPVRSYFFAGTSHGPAPFPPTSLVEDAPMANPVSASASIYALRMAMHRWVTEGLEPPASVHPSFRDGTLVPISKVAFPKVPGMPSPRSVNAGVRVRNPQWPDGAGAGTELPLFVPQSDADGNDLGGIRMPDIAVPLGTATGWVFRPEAMGSPHEFYLLRGAWVPFALSKEQREKAGDPRLSIEERYDSKEDYLKQVKTVLEDLVEKRFLEDRDLESQLSQAANRWDWVTNRVEP
ncbi:MAG: hypothetical protein KDN18_04085 [Verrucomicrobiae bacterium]|nr:hypothetical protein [Verrucomicrobiae bacterium]